WFLTFGTPSDSRGTLNKFPRTSWRHLFRLTAPKILEIRQYSCGFLACQTKNLLAMPHTLIYSAFP
ncbi:MAG: hypothetical protein IJ649_09915, partial [Oscillospiraceae bacterium]|nr:hypothetical protein [Oscillospiraceae bacterium]